MKADKDVSFKLPVWKIQNQMNDHICVFSSKALDGKTIFENFIFPREKNIFDWIRKSYQTTQVLFEGFKMRAFSSFVVILAQPVPVVKTLKQKQHGAKKR